MNLMSTTTRDLTDADVIAAVICIMAIICIATIILMRSRYKKEAEKALEHERELGYAAGLEVGKSQGFTEGYLYQQRDAAAVDKIVSDKKSGLHEDGS